MIPPLLRCGACGELFGGAISLCECLVETIDDDCQAGGLGMTVEEVMAAYPETWERSMAQIESGSPGLTREQVKTRLRERAGLTIAEFREKYAAQFAGVPHADAIVESLAYRRAGGKLYSLEEAREKLAQEACRTALESPSDLMTSAEVAELFGENVPVTIDFTARTDHSAVESLFTSFQQLEPIEVKVELSPEAQGHLVAKCERTLLDNYMTALADTLSDDNAAFQRAVCDGITLGVVTPRDLAAKFGASLVTVERWRTGVNAPHEAGRYHVLDYLMDRALEKDRVDGRAPGYAVHDEETVEP